MMEKRLSGRNVLITGASRGLGAALARRFASEGATVILLAQTQGALEELDDTIRKESGTSAILVPMSLADFDRIDQVGASIYQRFGHLDILVGNAATLGQLSPVGHIDPPLWDKVVAVNATANYRLIRSLDPLLRRSDSGRAIFTGDSLSEANIAYWGGYAASKAMLRSIVLTYAAEMRTTSVRVNLVEPGTMRTRLRATAFPGENPEKCPPPENVTGTYIDLALPSCTRHGEIVRPPSPLPAS